MGMRRYCLVTAECIFCEKLLFMRINENGKILFSYCRMYFAPKFEQQYVRCVRNEEECVCSPLQISLQYPHQW